MDQQVSDYLRHTAIKSESNPDVTKNLVRLTERRIQLERNLGLVNCELELVEPHWSDKMALDECMTTTNISLWSELRAEMGE